MSLICFHASHEQLAPSRLLELVQLAEHAGFDAIHSSDHFHPWSAKQGHSGFSFSWIAAALQCTKLPYSLVCAPGQRYHPAIVAQAISTLAEMFPGRINFELGSGEAINEKITGDPWPAKETRNERLLDCANIIRRLLNGDEVSHHGSVQVQQAKLYTRPKYQPLLHCVAMSAETSAWAATWADGLLTTAEKTTGETVTKMKAFYENGGHGKPVYLQYSFSYADDIELAIDVAYDQWRGNLIPKDKLALLNNVEAFDKAAENITREQVKDSIPCFTDIESLMSNIDKLAETGADRIILHNINNQAPELFVKDYGRWKKPYEQKTIRNSL